ncbi:hypothetical protein HHI36_000654 [Cryptolaemus montrouzieri]|uniref:Glucose-methanol-choline oxidoreductase N-terminal domain-containing protein n=1 Tax=Cryptolaemus montrouzieri TaxID=559131 RepID=A0ABD2P670_9CUCU
MKPNMHSFCMKISIIFMIYLVLVTCTKEQFKLKVDYYNSLIKNALEQTKEYKSRQDNSDFFKNIKDGKIVEGWKGNKCSYARGKVLGGSGSINYLAYTRGNKGDYNKWASLGNKGWSFDDVLPYFQKLENFESENIDRSYRGFGGPVNVAYKIPKENFTMIQNAHSEIGLNTVDDYNGKQQIGVSRMQRSIKYGRRVSGATAYVRPSSVRHNFNVTLEAFVTKILIDTITKSANGVQFIKNGRLFVAKARKEIIVSGGAINTPQLLMLSGIGPEDELTKHGIHVIENLPVGKFLKDHYVFQVSYKTNMTVETKPFCKYIEDYLNGEGILTNIENAVSFTFLNTRNISASIPNIELVFFLPTPITTPMPPRANFTTDIQKYLKKLDQHTNIYLAIFLLHPKSVGTLSLQSNSPKDFPLIDLGIFSDPEDMEDFYKAIQIVNKIGETKAVQKVEAEQIEFQFCNQYAYDSKEYWYCALQHMATPGMHVSSTVRMGPTNDPFAVVDSHLNVYGVKNLRVADCSVMPITISGHTNGAALMIGEKAADIIKKDHNILL